MQPQVVLRRACRASRRWPRLGIQWNSFSQNTLTNIGNEKPANGRAARGGAATAAARDQN